MSKLGKKLFIIFLILVILSLLLVGIFINFSIGERFDNFINLQREENISELAEMIGENFNNNNFSRIRSLVENFSRTNRIPIWVEDSKGEFIYFPAQNNQMSNMMRRMGMNNESRMNHMNMMRQLPDDFPGQNKEKDIIVDGEKVLTLHWKEVSGENQLNSELYSYFKNNIYRAIIFSAFFVTILIIGLSFILSKKITSPLIKVKNAALAVAQGNYQQNIEGKGDDELAELIDAFNLMSRKLHKLEKIRKESTSDLAHELRTPLTTIKGYLEAIEDGKMEADQETIKEMQEESQRMTILIEKLNEFANAQNKIFNLTEEKVNLNTIIKKVIKQHHNFLNKKNIKLKLKLDANLYIKGDKDSLFQIFNNIIENAIKYNVVNGKIEVESSADQEKLTIAIRDSGVGISDKDLPYIFERFYRADKSRNSSNQGTGIGLAVVKELMDAHQGKIVVENEAGGTVFKLIFPAA
ncbi:HAMP domain-containing sensor histidine kinase [Halanaerobium congolense]|jgi:signal transduction histidine kinase|uniref:histidine kinase n=1 Tax=Halanaerobium congolense TaxID=54121 RepID=A0A1G6P5Z8_9FIRM|nr:HAMP domain-containing sensor histidine kinase [Halanaerobium congolense]OEG63649.1 MAG: histidine kinase [Halanaerobium sp. MDAL1]TDS33742.1 signal transduction histidine kinase [Halanaerobium congolense]SDC75593.1 Signal transduction histidine kinase [Halanaerobium congolense]SDK38846.1 Signal transduction histidine kinase [Halanaerobium congolense]SDM03490.1 Signal transduction histidine kinase [Halanaerobium congolense]